MISGSADFGWLLALTIPKAPPIIAKIAPTQAMRPRGIAKNTMEKMIASIPPTIGLFHNATIAEISSKIPRVIAAAMYISNNCMAKSMNGADSGGSIGSICNTVK